MIKNGIVELHELLDNGSVTCSDLVNESIRKAHNLQNNCNAFVTIIDDAKNDCKSDSILCGIPFGVKDNYSTKGVLSTGSSNTLKDYVPFFDATAVENLKKCGAVMVAKTALDEFGMGGTGTTAHTGVIKNPWDKKRICGGSSAGSACSVAAGVYPFAFGSDTGDSIRKPAAYCGVVGYKPTYGMISRLEALKDTIWDCIILDEAQNTTPAQMKMFLTRIGFGSKVVITGDATQKDLPSGQVSGLDVATRVVKDIEDISICHLTSKDVVRHPLVQRIVKAYEDYESKHENRRGNDAKYKGKDKRRRS